MAKGVYDDLFGPSSDGETAYGAVMAKPKAAPSKPLVGFAARALDVLQRGTYASAGAAEEMVNPSPEYAGMTLPQRMRARALEETFSGAFGAKGKKRAFTEVMERAGIGPIAQASQIPLVRNLFSETGEGAPLKAGGWADVTLRGTIGLGLDIALDPSTYVTLGTTGATKAAGQVLGRKGLAKLGEEIATETPKIYQAMKQLPGHPQLVEEYLRLAGTTGTKEARVIHDLARKSALEKVAAAAATDPSLLDRGGLKWMGLTFPGSPELVTLTSGASKHAIAYLGRTRVGATPLALAKHLKETMGHAFDTTYGLMPEYIPIRQAWIDGTVVIGTELRREARPIVRGFRKMRAKDIEALFDHYEANGLEGLGKEHRELMTAWKSLMDKMLASENARGMLKDAPIVPHYIARFYENTAQEVDDVIQHYGVRSTIGMHAEERTFATRAQARKALGHRLTLVTDPAEILSRRINTHAAAVSGHDFFQELASKWGTPRGFDPTDVYDLARSRWPGKLTAKQFSEYQGVLDLADQIQLAPAKKLAALSSEARSEYIRLKIMKAQKPEDALRIVDRYAKTFPDALPSASKSGKRALDGSLYTRLTGIPMLAKYDVPESIAKDITYLTTPALREGSLTAKILGTIVPTLDAFTNAFKTGVTVFFPAFQFRNIYSNPLFAFADVGISALHPKLHADAFMVRAGRDGLFKTPFGDWTYQEIRDSIKALNLKRTAHQKLEWTGERFARVRALEGAKEFVGGAAAGVDNYFITQHYMNYLRRGASPEDAAARVKQVFYDYNALTRFEKEVMKRAFPFYTFQRKNIARQIYNLKHKPGLTAVEVKLFTGRESETGAIEEYGGPEWMWRLDRDGKTVTALRGIDLPLGDLDTIWKGTLGETFRGIENLLHPIPKTIIEQGTKTNLFTGRPFPKHQESYLLGLAPLIDKAPKAVQDLVLYEKKFDRAGKPHYTFDGRRLSALFRSWAISRFLSTSDKVFIAMAEDKDMGPVLGNFITGINLDEIDLTQRQLMLMGKRTKQLKDISHKWAK